MYNGSSKTQQCYIDDAVGTHDYGRMQFICVNALLRLADVLSDVQTPGGFVGGRCYLNDRWL